MGAKLSYPEVDLAGKVALVTGGNTGIGYETAKGLARLGAHTFIACRSKEKAEAAIERIKSELSPPPKSSGTVLNDGGKDTVENDRKDSAHLTSESTEKEGGAKAEGRDKEGESSALLKGAGGAGSDSSEEGEGGIMKAADEEVRSKEKPDCGGSCRKEIKVDFLPLDLSSFQSTVDCVRLFKEKSLPLHVLVNNAGIFAVPYRKTGDGFESHFQVNHLGPMLFTLKLLPLLLETANTCRDVRIVFVSSSIHFMSRSFNPDVLDPTEANYKRLAMYNNTKMYNVMVGFALQRRLQGSFITVSSLCPGLVKTEVLRGIEDKKTFKRLIGIASSAISRSPEKGAATSLNCAVNASLNSREHIYYDSCRPKQPSADARSEQFQEELWKKSCEFLKDYLSPETLEKYGPKTEEKLAKPEEGDTTKSDVDITESEGKEFPKSADVPKAEGEETSKVEEEDTSKPEEEGTSKPYEEDNSKPEEDDTSKSEEGKDSK